ncbi:chorismate mutase [Alicycliphilus sp. B1]|nr:chorismate mutase [Alicycliphilus sp. B1]
MQIDSLDHQLLQLVNQRARVAEQVGELKKREGTPFFRPDRVAQVIEKIQGANPAAQERARGRHLARDHVRVPGARIAPARGRAGPEGTFCEQAAIEYFGGAADLMYCNSFDEVFHATAAGSAQYGVVGVENSNEGVVTRSLDMFLHTPCHVVGEVSLLIRHNLLRSVNSAEGIEAVLAHPQALAQCHAWLAKHLPHAERRPVSSNRGRAPGRHQPGLGRHIEERAAQQYGLRGGTRHPGRRLQPHALRHHLPAAHAGHARAHGPRLHQLIISVPNRPGAVHDLLVPLKKHGVSMTRFESRPRAPASGSTTSTSTSKATRRGQRGRRAGRAAAAVCLLQAARHLPRRCVRSGPCLNNSA